MRPAYCMCKISRYLYISLSSLPSALSLSFPSKMCECIWVLEAVDVEEGGGDADRSRYLT